jgi:hypothetical protein
MRNFFYCCEVNLAHPQVEETFKDYVSGLTSEDARIATFTSRPFADQGSVYDSMERDVAAKMKKVITKDPNIELTKINELNPSHINSSEDLEARKAEDKEYAEYVDSWDTDLLCKVTCTSEELEVDNEGDLVSMPKDFIFKYYVRSFDDGIVLPKGTMMTVENYTSTLQ